MNIPPELLAALQGGGGAPAGGQPDEEQSPDEIIGQAINLVHQAMVSDQDPKGVSLLGAILNQLTTYQANRSQAQQGK